MSNKGRIILTAIIFGSLILAPIKISDVKGDLSAPILTYPASGSHINDDTPTFTWESVTDAVSYQIQVTLVLFDFTSPIINETTSNTYYECAISLSLGYSPQDIQWRVAGINSSGHYGPWSSAIFTLDMEGPSYPIGLIPMNGSVIEDTTPTFGWTYVDNPGDVLIHQIQLDNSSDFLEPIINATFILGGFDKEYTSPIELIDGIYYWRVRGLDIAGNIGGWSGIRVLFIDTTAPKIVEKPTEMVFEDGNPDNNVTWIMEDFHPDKYEIHIDDVFYTSGIWSSGEPIVVMIDTLTIGVYNISITVNDTLDHIIFDSIIISVVEIIQEFESGTEIFVPLIIMCILIVSKRKRKILVK